MRVRLAARPIALFHNAVRLEIKADLANRFGSRFERASCPITRGRRMARRIGMRVPPAEIILPPRQRALGRLVLSNHPGAARSTLTAKELGLPD